MMNNRGQFFPIYLVALTLLMCALAIGIYLLQSRNVDNSIVSPVSVLQISDKISDFNSVERSWIYESMRENKEKWDNKNAFRDSFKKIFFGKINLPASNDFRSFAFPSSSAIDDKFFGEAYSIDFDSSGKNFIIERRSFTKEVVLFASDRSKISFPVSLTYSYGKKWVCDEKFVCI